MGISSANFYVVLVGFTLAEASVNSLLPLAPISEVEVISFSIVQRYLPFVYDIQFVCEKACVPDQLLKKLKVPVLLSNPRLRRGSFLFVLTESRSFVTSALKRVVDSAKGKYVILLNCFNCVSVEWVLKECWHHKILNVVVISIENGTFEIYTYYPFREKSCFNSAPVLIGSFNTSANLTVELFPDRKMWNLHQCPLTVSSFEQYPLIYFQGGKLKGRFSPVFDAVADFMNFSSKFIHTDGKGWFGSASEKIQIGIRGDVFTEQAHLGFTLLHPIDFQNLDYDTLSMTGCLSWCLASTFKHKPLWWLIVGEFTPTVWIVLIISAAVVSATDFLIQKYVNWLYGKARMDSLVLEALFQKAAEKMPRYSILSFRLLWIAWLIVSLVITTGYLSAYKSLRTAPIREYALRTLQDVADAGLQAWYHRGFSDLVDLASESNPAVVKLRANSFIYPSVMTGRLVELFKYRNVTGLVLDKVCSMWSEVNGVDMYSVSEDCMQVMPCHFFVMSKNSIFSNEVNTVLGRMMQAGIVQRVLTDEKKSSRRVTMEKRPISMKTMLPVFLLLGWGLLVGVVLFCLELVLVIN